MLTVRTSIFRNNFLAPRLKVPRNSMCSFVCCLQEKIKKCKSGSDTRKLRSELRFLKKELFERERKAIKSVLSSADVILSTTTSASDEGPLKHLNEDHFDLIIIDEAAQALEASCWIPLNHGNR